MKEPRAYQSHEAIDTHAVVVTAAEYHGEDPHEDATFVRRLEDFVPVHLPLTRDVQLPNRHLGRDISKVLADLAKQREIAFGELFHELSKMG